VPNSGKPQIRPGSSHNEFREVGGAARSATIADLREVRLQMRAIERLRRDLAQDDWRWAPALEPALRELVDRA
jgi:hypothetical protein